MCNCTLIMNSSSVIASAPSVPHIPPYWVPDQLVFPVSQNIKPVWFCPASEKNIRAADMAARGSKLVFNSLQPASCGEDEPELAGVLFPFNVFNPNSRPSRWFQLFIQQILAINSAFLRQATVAELAGFIEAFKALNVREFNITDVFATGETGKTSSQSIDLDQPLADVVVYQACSDEYQFPTRKKLEGYMCRPNSYMLFIVKNLKE